MSTWTYMNIKGQGHSLTLDQGHSDSTFSNFFSWEAARSIEAKFHVDPPWDGGMKVCSNGPGHMTKMAAMPTYGKNMKNSSLCNQRGWWHWKLICSIRYLNTTCTKFVQMMTLGWPWPILWQGQILILWQGQILSLMKVKQWTFQILF